MRTKQSQFPCSFPGCSVRAMAMRLCSGHYSQVYDGRPLEPIERLTAQDRFERFVTPEPMSGCWLWTGAVNRTGYGVFGLNGESVPAHRASVFLFVGPIPTGLHVDHLCRNTYCVNPKHLEPVTPRVNALRGVSPAAIAAKSTHCMMGHEYTPENTRARPGSPHQRICRACAKVNAQFWKLVRQSKRLLEQYALDQSDATFVLLSGVMDHLGLAHADVLVRSRARAALARGGK